MFADQIARQLHKGQHYGEYDYFSEHVQDVANRVARQTSGSTFTAIAYLHDVVEDCDITLEQLGGYVVKGYLRCRHYPFCCRRLDKT